MFIQTENTPNPFTLKFIPFLTVLEKLKPVDPEAMNNGPKMAQDGPKMA